MLYFEVEMYELFFVFVGKHLERNHIAYDNMLTAIVWFRKH